MRKELEDLFKSIRILLLSLIRRLNALSARRAADSPESVCGDLDSAKSSTTRW